jgi:hypothetical protein
MELYIRIKDGQPFEHPILGDNFRQAFPTVDTNNLPLEFARFERIERPVINVYEVYEGVTYQWDDGFVKDVHYVRPMTEEEKIAKQNEVKNSFPDYEEQGYVFDEETCSFKLKQGLGATRV